MIMPKNGIVLIYPTYIINPNVNMFIWYTVYSECARQPINDGSLFTSCILVKSSVGFVCTSKICNKILLDP